MNERRHFKIKDNIKYKRIDKAAESDQTPMKTLKCMNDEMLYLLLDLFSAKHKTGHFETMVDLNLLRYS